MRRCTTLRHGLPGSVLSQFLSFSDSRRGHQDSLGAIAPGFLQTLADRELRVLKPYSLRGVQDGHERRAHLS